MFRFFHIPAQDILKTKFGTGLIIFFISIFIASCLVLAVPIPNIDLSLALGVSVGSFFISVALLAVRFEQHFEKILTVLALFFNIASWIWLFAEIIGEDSGPGGGAAAVVIFFMIQIFTLPKLSRDLNAISPLYERRFKWFLILLFLILIFGSIAWSVATY
jgi:hypothetical protein